MPRPSVSFSSEAKNLEGRGLLEDDTGGENKASFSCYKVVGVGALDKPRTQGD